MAIEIPIKRLTKEKIGEIADNFLKDYGSGFPVEIELIAEKIGIKIIPIPGLKRDIAGVEGFIKPDLTEIVVDEGVYFNYPSRARFTIAHEVGHFVLHKQVYDKIRAEMNPETFEDYATFLLEQITEEDHGWIEWQSSEFAGRVLVPGRELKIKLEELINSRKTLQDDAMMPVVDELAEYFDVSSYVIGRRIKNEGLIQITQKRMY